MSQRVRLSNLMARGLYQQIVRGFDSHTFRIQSNEDIQIYSGSLQKIGGTASDHVFKEVMMYRASNDHCRYFKDIKMGKRRSS